MRAMIFTVAALAACDGPDGRPGPPSGGGGVVVPPPVETSTGSTGEARPRLDLGDWPDLPAGSSGGTSTGSTGGEPTSGSTGLEPVWTGGSTGEPGTSSGTSGTSTGATSTGEPGSSSGGDPLPACPCTPEAAAAMNLCGLPPGTCEPVKPGGYCDPNGDMNFADGDWVLGWQEWTALCA